MICCLGSSPALCCSWTLTLKVCCAGPIGTFGVAGPLPLPPHPAPHNAPAARDVCGRDGGE